VLGAVNLLKETRPYCSGVLLRATADTTDTYKLICLSLSLSLSVCLSVCLSLSLSREFIAPQILLLLWFKPGRQGQEAKDDKMTKSY